MVAFPPLQTTSTSPCAAPYNSLEWQRYDGYDSADRGYLTDQINSDYKTRHGPRTRPRVSTCTRTRATPPRASRPAATPPTARRCARPRPSSTAHGRAERPRLHRLPDRRRGQHRQRLQRERPDLSTRATPTTSSRATRPITSPTVQGRRRDDLQHRLRARRATPAAPPATSDRTSRHVQDSNGQHRHARAPAARQSRRGCYHKADQHERESRRSPRTTRSRRSPRPATSTTSRAPVELNTIFAAIATDIGSGSSRLVDDGF